MSRSDLSHIEVLSAHEEEALSLFRAAGFEPDVVARDDGKVRFTFEQVEDERKYKLATAIPFDFYAKRAIVGGSPFDEGHEQRVKQ